MVLEVPPRTGGSAHVCVMCDVVYSTRYRINDTSSDLRLRSLLEDRSIFETPLSVLHQRKLWTPPVL